MYFELNRVYMAIKAYMQPQLIVIKTILRLIVSKVSRSVDLMYASTAKDPNATPNFRVHSNIDVTECITETLGLTDMEISDNFNLKVYPNPITDFIFLDFQSTLSGNLKATFFDVLGRELMPTKPDFNFNSGHNSIIMNLKELDAMRGQIIFGLFTFNTSKGLIQKSVKLILE